MKRPLAFLLPLICLGVFFFSTEALGQCRDLAKGGNVINPRDKFKIKIPPPSVFVLYGTSRNWDSTPVRDGLRQEYRIDTRFYLKKASAFFLVLGGGHTTLSDPENARKIQYRSVHTGVGLSFDILQHWDTPGLKVGRARIKPFFNPACMMVYNHTFAKEDLLFGEIISREKSGRFLFQGFLQFGFALSTPKAGVFSFAGGMYLRDLTGKGSLSVLVGPMITYTPPRELEKAPKKEM
jgi:hypothetical protein